VNQLGSGDVVSDMVEVGSDVLEETAQQWVSAVEMRLRRG
jgi:hypothetical protein